MLDIVGDHDLQDAGVDDPAIREKIILLVRERAQQLPALSMPTPIDAPAGMVEELARVRHDAFEAAGKRVFGGTGAGWPSTAWEAAPIEFRSLCVEATRAVLATLAAKGVDALPGVDDVLGADLYSSIDQVVAQAIEMCRVRLALILAAKDAEIATLRTRVAEADKQAVLWRELQERAIPCGHKVEDLIGAPGTVTKCGACLSNRIREKTDALRDVTDHLERCTASTLAAIGSDARTLGNPCPPTPPPPQSIGVTKPPPPPPPPPPTVAPVELECGMGGACVWVDSENGERVCDRCVRNFEDRFEDRIAYRETKLRVRRALDNSSYGNGPDARRGAEEAVKEWAAR